MKRFLRALVFVLITVFLVSCSLSGDNNEQSGEVVDQTLPRSPSPANNEQNQSLVVTLSWVYDGAETFDIYFGENTPPRTLIAANRAENSLIVPGLDYSTRYYWQVIAELPNGDIVEGPIWSFVTKPRGTTDEGYVLIDYGLETEPPTFVNVFFQVIDLNGIGVDNLTTSDFEVYEDGEQVSISESNLQVIKSDELPYTLQLVLMLDNSSSLLNNLDDIIIHATNFVNSLSPQFEMAVYKFSEDPILIQDFTSDKAVLINAINDIKNDVYETTDLYGAVIEGADKMEDSFSRDEIIQTAMIIFTDGDDTQAEHTLSEALNAASSKRIYTVGLGTDVKPEVLEKIGNAGFFAIGDVGELSDTFIEIEDELVKYANSFYQIRYKSPKRGNKLHDLLIQMVDNPNNSVIRGTFNSKDFFSASPGVYVNATPDNPTGVSEITMIAGGSEVVEGSSFYGDLEPVYEWLSLSPTIVEVSVDVDDPSIATLRAVGSSGQSGIVRLRDTANGFTKAITVRIQ